MNLKKRSTTFFIGGLLLGAARLIQAADVKAATPGEFIVHPPTLINLGFEWVIERDDNRNALVEVSYRRKGELPWNTSSDYNGFRPNPGAPYAFQWNSPQMNVVADYNSRGHNAKTETRRFSTLAEYSKTTGQDQHSVLIDYDAFVHVPKLDGHDVRTVQKLYKALGFDFRIKPDSAAVDRAVILPNVTDGFTGKAPGLGALEVGQEVPHYGPRE